MLASSDKEPERRSTFEVSEGSSSTTEVIFALSSADGTIPVGSKLSLSKNVWPRMFFLDDENAEEAEEDGDVDADRRRRFIPLIGSAKAKASLDSDFRAAGGGGAARASAEWCPSNCINTLMSFSSSSIVRSAEVVEPSLFSFNVSLRSLTMQIRKPLNLFFSLDPIR